MEKISIKERLSRLKGLKKGIQELSPLQQSKAKLVSAIGTLVGFTLAFISLGVKLYIVFDWTQFFFEIIILFAIVGTWVQYVSAKQEIQGLKDMEKLIGDKNV